MEPALCVRENSLADYVAGRCQPVAVAAGVRFSMEISWIAAVVIMVLLLVAVRRRRRAGSTFGGGPGPGAAGAIYEMLNEDKRKAIEIIVEERAEERDPETADGNLPELESPGRPRT